MDTDGHDGLIVRQAHEAQQMQFTYVAGRLTKQQDLFKGEQPSFTVTNSSRLRMDMATAYISLDSVRQQSHCVHVVVVIRVQASRLNHLMAIEVIIINAPKEQLT